MNTPSHTRNGYRKGADGLPDALRKALKRGDSVTKIEDYRGAIIEIVTRRALSLAERGTLLTTAAEYFDGLRR